MNQQPKYSPRLSGLLLPQDHLDKAIELKPQDPLSYYLLGRWCYAVCDARDLLHLSPHPRALPPWKPTRPLVSLCKHGHRFPLISLCLGFPHRLFSPWGCSGEGYRTPAFVSFQSDCKLEHIFMQLLVNIVSHIYVDSAPDSFHSVWWASHWATSSLFGALHDSYIFVVIFLELLQSKCQTSCQEGNKLLGGGSLS